VLAEAVLLQLAELLAERLPVLLRSVEASMPAVDQARAPGPTTATGRARTGREVLLEVLGRTARATPAGDAPEAQRHRAAIGRLLRDEEFGAFVATRLPAQIVPLFADAIRPLLAGRSALDVMRTLQAAGVPLTTAELLACLRSQSYGRPQFLMSLPPDAPPEVVREVEGLVRDPDLSVRIGACEALGRTLSPDSVAALLPALRDATEGVRTAAAEALQRIRLYHEQKAFWDQFQQGITTGREAAAGKLLLQAKPEQPKEQRLLAIRSLGALGAPEALPYLIDWCQDGDAEVAAAARAAIGSIHQQAGGK
jgi:hypothetical protein